MNQKLFSIELNVSNYYTSYQYEVGRVLAISIDDVLNFCKNVLITDENIECMENVIMYYEPDESDTDDYEYGTSYTWVINEIEKYTEYDFEINVFTGDGDNIESRFWDITMLTDYERKELEKNPSLWMYIASVCRVVSDFETNKINMNDLLALVNNDIKINREDIEI